MTAAQPLRAARWSRPTGCSSSSASAGQIGDAGDLYAGPAARFADDTTPNSKWWNGTSSNLTIDQISAAGATITLPRPCFGDTVTPPQTLRRESQPEPRDPRQQRGRHQRHDHVTEALTIAAIKSASTSRTPYRGDLRVTLTTPWGALIELHPQGQGGNADDLKVTFDETVAARRWPRCAGAARRAPGG